MSKNVLVKEKALLEENLICEHVACVRRLCYGVRYLVRILIGSVVYECVSAGILVYKAAN